VNLCGTKINWPLGKRPIDASTGTTLIEASGSAGACLRRYIGSHADAPDK
jgi:hypothetical protein